MAGVVGGKRDLTDQEGLARRVSRSSGRGLVVEEWVRVRFAGAEKVLIDWNLLARMDLSSCLCGIAQRC